MGAVARLVFAQLAREALVPLAVEPRRRGSGAARRAVDLPLDQPAQRRIAAEIRNPASHDGAGRGWLDCPFLRPRATGPASVRGLSAAAYRGFPRGGGQDLLHTRRG